MSAGTSALAGDRVRDGSDLGQNPPELDLGGCAVDVPETRYAKLGRHRIAYQVVTGDGPLDVLFVPPAGDCIDLRWEWPSSARILRRLASLGRLIMFDRRGQGASDAAPSDGAPRWERWADDALAVL